MHQKGMSAGRCPRHAIVRLFAAVSRLGCVRPNVLRFSCRLAAFANANELRVVVIPKRKKALISRAARRSTATACWAGPGSSFTYGYLMVLYSWLWNEDTTYTNIALNVKHYFDEAAATSFTVGALIQAIQPRHRNNWQRRGRVLLTDDLL
jgi:hypothetical protein